MSNLSYTCRQSWPRFIRKGVMALCFMFHCSFPRYEWRFFWCRPLQGLLSAARYWRDSDADRPKSSCRRWHWKLVQARPVIRGIVSCWPLYLWQPVYGEKCMCKVRVLPSVLSQILYNVVQWLTQVSAVQMFYHIYTVPLLCLFLQYFC